MVLPRLRRQFLLILAASLTMLCAVPAAAVDLPIDLTGIDAHIRKGFDPAWITALPDPGNENWVLIPGRKQNRPLRVMDLPFKDTPSWRPFRRYGKDETYTYLFRFTLGSTQLRGAPLALYLSQAGQNWAVYLNGSLLHDEEPRNAAGTIIARRELRKQLIGIPQSLLRDGDNILAFKITGDPTVDRTGFFMTRDYFIGDYATLAQLADSTGIFMFLGVYLFFGCYHLLLFMRRRKERYNLYFALSMISLTLYYFVRTNAAATLVEDTALLKHVELAAMISMVALLRVFLDDIVAGRISLFTKIWSALSIAFAAAIIPFEREILPVWQVLLPVFLVYLLFADIIVPLTRAVRAESSGNKEDTVIVRYTKAFAKALAASIPGNLLIGVIFIVVTGTIDVIRMKMGIPSTLTQYGVFVIIVGIVVMLANRFLRVHSQMEILNLTLEQKVKDRTEKLQNAYEEIEAAMSEIEAMNESLMMTNRRLEDAQRIISMDLSMAAHVQSSFLPKNPPASSDWETAFYFRPMSGVSGDLYDFYLMEGNLLGLSLFDVSGHGVSSGLITMLSRSIIYHRFMEGINKKLTTVMEEINDNLIEEIGPIDNYLTGVLLRFEGDTVQYVNAGHTDLLRKNGATGEVKTVTIADREIRGYFLGIELMKTAFQGITFKVKKNDCIVLFSDCLNENRNAQGEPFGVECITRALTTAPGWARAAAILDHLIQAFNTHVGDAPITDDLTILIAKRLI